MYERSIWTFLGVAVFLAVSTTAAAQSGGLLSPSKDGSDLQALCQNRTIDLTRISQLGLLVVKLDGVMSGDCPEDTKIALRNLKTVIDTNKGDECSMMSYERYKAFYMDFLDTSDKQRKKPPVKLPKSLRNFALAYGIQLSGACRLNMVRELVDVSRRTIKRSDIEFLKPLIGPKGPIAVAIGYQGSRPDEIILPSDFAAAAAESESHVSKITMKFKTAPFIRDIKALCERRLRPIYEPLMLPVAKMANLGFSYRRKSLKEEIRKVVANAETKDLISEWTRILFACELTRNMILIEDGQDRARSEGNDATMVQIESRGSIRGASVECRDLLRDKEGEMDRVEQIVFKPKLSVEISDKILDTMRQRLSVLMLRTNIGENKRIRIRFAKKMGRRLLKYLLHYRFDKVLSFFTKELITNIRQLPKNSNRRRVPSSDVQTDIVKYLNELVDNQLNPDKAVSDNLEFHKKTLMIFAWVAAIVVVLAFLLAHFLA